MSINMNLYEKKRKFDNEEINVTDLSEEELKLINEMYNKQISELKKKIKRSIL